ncbi:MAG: hypothetical protein H0V22_01915 [Solirubrobacterales bacterium]|jgi:HD-GYP domain-containing protein (c-di-GMP phosphodiesterase class II)|nr:hypothetical protein [Solirubrobacterales bacterium]
MATTRKPVAEPTTSRVRPAGDTKTDNVKAAADRIRELNEKHTETTEAAADRFREISERMGDESRKFGLTSIDAYEKSFNGVADLQHKLARNSQVEWVSTVLDAQSDFTRSVTEAYASAGRELLTK